MSGIVVDPTVKCKAAVDFSGGTNSAIIRETAQHLAVVCVSTVSSEANFHSFRQVRPTSLPSRCWSLYEAFRHPTPEYANRCDRGVLTSELKIRQSTAEVFVQYLSQQRT